MRKRSSKGGGEQRSIQVHLMVNEEEAAMIRAAARKRNQTVSLTIIEAVKLLDAIAGFGAHRDRERKGPVPEDTGPTPNRGCIQGHPTGLGHLPEEVVAHRLENGKKLARLQPALSMLADTIVPVDRRPLARVERDRPATAGRRCRASRGAAQRKGAEMRDSGKGPRGGPIIWLMAVIAVCLAPPVRGRRR